MRIQHGAQASLPDDHDESAVVGIDLWDDAQSVISSCTTDDCVFDAIVSVQNDCVMNLENWADEAGSTHVSSRRTCTYCVFDPIVFMQNDGVMNLGSLDRDSFGDET